MRYFGFSWALPGGGTASGAAVTRRNVQILKTAILGNGKGRRWRHRHEGGGAEAPDRRLPSLSHIIPRSGQVANWQAYWLVRGSARRARRRTRPSVDVAEA